MLRGVQMITYRISASQGLQQGTVQGFDRFSKAASHFQSQAPCHNICIQPGAHRIIRSFHGQPALYNGGIGHGFPRCQPDNTAQPRETIQRGIHKI